MREAYAIWDRIYLLDPARIYMSSITYVSSLIPLSKGVEGAQAWGCVSYVRKTSKRVGADPNRKANMFLLDLLVELIYNKLNAETINKYVKLVDIKDAWNLPTSKYRSISIWLPIK